MGKVLAVIYLVEFVTDALSSASTILMTGILCPDPATSEPVWACDDVNGGGSKDMDLNCSDTPPTPSPLGFGPLPHPVRPLPPFETSPPPPTKRPASYPLSSPAPWRAQNGLRSAEYLVVSLSVLNLTVC